MLYTISMGTGRGKGRRVNTASVGEKNAKRNPTGQLRSAGKTPEGSLREAAAAKENPPKSLPNVYTEVRKNKKKVSEKLKYYAILAPEDAQKLDGIPAFQEQKEIIFSLLSDLRLKSSLDVDLDFLSYTEAQILINCLNLENFVKNSYLCQEEHVTERQWRFLNNYEEIGKEKLFAQTLSIHEQWSGTKTTPTDNGEKYKESLENFTGLRSTGTTASEYSSGMEKQKFTYAFIALSKLMHIHGQNNVPHPLLSKHVASEMISTIKNNPGVYKRKPGTGTESSITKPQIAFIRKLEKTTGSSVMDQAKLEKLSKAKASEMIQKLQTKTPKH